MGLSVLTGLDPRSLIPTAQMADALAQLPTTSWPAAEPAIYRHTVPRQMAGSAAGHDELGWCPQLIVTYTESSVRICVHPRLPLFFSEVATKFGRQPR